MNRSAIKPASNQNSNTNTDAARLLNSDNIWLWGSLSIAFLFLIIRLLLGEDSFVTIHDNLDSEIPWRFALANSSGSDRVYSIMNGLPASFMVTRLNLLYGFFTVFPPFIAYVLNEAFVHAVAFAGMALLLQTHFRSIFSKTISTGVALAFSLLPFYSIYGLSIAGQPLLLACFLNLRNRNNLWLSYGFIAFYCFYSSLVLAGVFIMATVGCYWLWLAFRTRNLQVPFLLGLVLMAAAYGISEANLIRLLIYKPEPSHRDAWDLIQLSFPFKGAFTHTLQDFLLGQYHVSSQHLGILVLALVAVLFSLGRPTVSLRNWLFGLLAVAGMLAVIFGFYNWDALNPVKERILLLKTFNFSRFYWFQPLVWYLIFALTLSLLYERFRSKKMIIGAIAAQVFCTIGNPAPLNFLYQSIVEVVEEVLFPIGSPMQTENELHTNLTLLESKITGKKSAKAPVITYRQFISADVFEQVKKAIGKPAETYRIISLGISPAAAQLNGFYTLDSYQNNYPLRYKRQFREIIAPELAKSPHWRTYFDGWGSRCYVFSSEVTSNTSSATPIRNLQLNYAALYKLGGRYLFSAYEVENAQPTGLKLTGTFKTTNPEVPVLYVYEILQ